MVEVAPNDAEYMITYLSSTQYLVVSPSEKELIQKNLFFALDASATIPHHIPLCT